MNERRKTDRRVEPSGLSLKLRACGLLATMILEGDELVTKDERAQPELRDIERLSRADQPLTIAGKRALQLAGDGEAPDAEPEPAGAGDCG